MWPYRNGGELAPRLPAEDLQVFERALRGSVASLGRPGERA